MGRHKEGWTYILRHEPDYFGKKGFTSRQSLSQRLSLINVGELEELLDRQTAKALAERKEGKVLLDLDKFGYDKLLGKGRITTPILVKVAFYSELAAKKIEDAGGRILKDQQAN